MVYGIREKGDGRRGEGNNTLFGVWHMVYSRMVCGVCCMLCVVRRPPAYERRENNMLCGVWCVVCLHAACCVVLHANTDVTTLLLPPSSFFFLLLPSSSSFFPPPLGTVLVWRIGGTRCGGSQGSTGTPPSHTSRSIPGYRGHRRLGEGEGGRRRKKEVILYTWLPWSQAFR